MDQPAEDVDAFDAHVRTGERLERSPVRIEISRLMPRWGSGGVVVLQIRDRAGQFTAAFDAVLA